MPDVVIDAHGLIWYLEDSPRLGSAAREALDACDRGEITVYVPTICLVEIIYLQEKRRIPDDLKALLDVELHAGTSGLALIALTPEIAGAVARVPRDEVPDMPDRIIAATALHMDLPLITRDRRIQLADVDTIW